MKRIARISIVGFVNYGCILQNYALERVLSKYGCVDTLFDNSNEYIDKRYHIEWNLKQAIKFIINRSDLRRFALGKKRLFDAAKAVRSKLFCDKYMNIRYDVNFSAIDSEYDYFVVGSDQVWNPGLPQRKDIFRKRQVSNIKYLKFADPSKRIAYAASIAQPDIPPALRDSFCESINEMAHIAVRENEGAELIKKYAGRDVDVVLDPTMLLTSAEWSEIESKPHWLSCDDRYVLTYFLGERIDDVVKKVAAKRNLQIVNLMDLDNFEQYITSPEEWIYLIHHAELIYTDSFHGTVFSILFKRPFVACDRIGKGIYSRMNSRIITLLSMFNLNNRHGTSANNYEINCPYDIEYGDIDAVLTVKRQEAIAYLDTAIK
mgnify:FL=1